jgi:hypothetical protein
VPPYARTVGTPAHRSYLSTRRRPWRLGALLSGSSTGWSRPPRSGGAGASQGLGEQRISDSTIAPNSRARRRLPRSKLPAATGSPAMTSGAAHTSPLLCQVTTEWSLGSQGRCAAAIADSESAPVTGSGRHPRIHLWTRTPSRPAMQLSDWWPKNTNLSYPRRWRRCSRDRERVNDVGRNPP